MEKFESRFREEQGDEHKSALERQREAIERITALQQEQQEKLRAEIERAFTEIQTPEEEENLTRAA